MRAFHHVFADLVRQHDDAVRDRQEAIVFRDTVGHHVTDCRAPLGPVKAFRCASTPHGADGLDRDLDRATDRPLRDGRPDQCPTQERSHSHA